MLTWFLLLFDVISDKFFQGIFPLAHVVDVDYNDFDPSGSEERKER